MKIISIDLAETWGIKDPETGEEYEWETDEESPALFSSSLITAVFPHEFPEDTTFTNDEEFHETSAQIAAVKDKRHKDETEAIRSRFEEYRQWIQETMNTEDQPYIQIIAALVHA